MVSHFNVQGSPQPLGYGEARHNLAFCPKKLRICIASMCHCILPLQPGCVLSVTGSTSGPSISLHCRESQEYASPELSLCLGEFWASLDCLNESLIWYRDLADQNLAEPLIASTGETFHTQNIKALSVYSEQQTHPKEKKSTKSWKACFSVVVQQFLLKDYFEIRAAEYCLVLVLSLRQEICNSWGCHLRNNVGFFPS